MTRRFNWVSALALALAASSCGTLLGVDEFAVDPNFEDDDESEPEPDAPNFTPDDDAGGDVEDDDADDDLGDDDVEDDDMADDDDVEDDDMADDDEDDDVADDDITAPDGGDDDIVEPDVTVDAGDDDVEPEPPSDDDMPEECFAPVSGDCDNLPQCGCGTDNCEFNLDDTGGTSCVPAGNRAPYSECTATSSQCPVGHSCVGGLCREFCSGETPTCAQGDYALCLPVGAGEGGEIPEFFTCARSCDPRDPTSEADGNLACGVGVACIPGVDGVSNCYATTASRAAGQGCADDYGYPDPFRCAPGLGCSAGIDGTPTCQPYCQVGSEDCGPGAECLPFEPSLLAGNTEIGTCLFCENVPSGGDCAYFPQCGCGEGEMCYPGQSSVSECLPAAELELNDVCAVGELCGPGLDCLYFTYSDAGVCTQLCEVDADCPGIETACVDLGYLDGTGHCLWGCDPRDPGNDYYPFVPCGADQSCNPLSAAGGSLCAPVPAAAAAIGGVCDESVDCEAGLGCGYANGCRPWCSPGSSDCAAATSSCFNNYGGLVSAGIEFGLCLESVLNFTSTLAATSIPDLGSVVSTITAPVGHVPTRITVEVDIVHTFVGDLRLELRAPNGTLIVLLSGTSLSGGANLTGTRFDDSGGNIRYYGAAPFEGAFQPETPLEVLNGTDIGGDWTLTAIDDAAEDVGILNSWTLHFW